MDSALHAKNALSGVEYQNAKNIYLQQLQEKSDFKRQINNTVNQFNIQSTQLEIVKRTIELSQKRYDQKINFV